MGGLRTTVGSIYLNAGIGIKIPRAAAADPQNVWLTIFTITGGVVLVTALVGVRTVIQAGGASLMQFRHSIGNTVLDNGTLAVTGQAVNTQYTLTGDPGDAILAGAAGAALFLGRQVATAGAYGNLGCAVQLFTGNIQVTMTAVAGTGSTRYVLIYIPIDAGATVAAAL